MNDELPRLRLYWEQFSDGEGTWIGGKGRSAGPPPGEELAVLRRGLGRVPGSVPAMWQFYTTRIDESRLRSWTDAFEPPPALEAEHHALTLFAIHQQSIRVPVHRRGFGLGTAMLQLRRSGRFSENALDRRFTAAATAMEISELVMHLRGLIRQLRTTTAVVPLDYTQLRDDLTSYAYADARQRLRRRWGAQYFDWSQRPDDLNEAPQKRERTTT